MWMAVEIAQWQGLQPLEELGYEIKTAEFSFEDYDQLQEANHKIEQQGPSAFEVAPELKTKMLEADMIVVDFCPISKELIAEHNHLKLVGTCRSGLSNIDTQACEKTGIPVVQI